MLTTDHTGHKTVSLSLFKIGKWLTKSENLTNFERVRPNPWMKLHPKKYKYFFGVQINLKIKLYLNKSSWIFTLSKSKICLEKT